MSKKPDTAIQVRIDGQLFERVENWRRSQPKIPPALTRCARSSSGRLERLSWVSNKSSCTVEPAARRCPIASRPHRCSPKMRRGPHLQ
jgi:hypothetical protein